MQHRHFSELLQQSVAFTLKNFENGFCSIKLEKVIDNGNLFWYTVQAAFGEVSEWFKEPVLKTGDSERGRGFESHLLRLCFFKL